LSPLDEGVAIRVEGLVKAFPLPTGGRHVALSNVDLAVMDSQFTCVVGPSGCGKTTLLGILGRLLRPDRGTVRVSSSRVAMVFQEHRLLPWRSVRDNVTFVLQGIDRREAARRADEVLALVGLGDVGDRFPNQLSGGMQQRAAIARAIATSPDLLLMDEPFSSLDEMTARRLRIELLSLWDRLRTTVVFVTHNALEACYLADRIVLMKQAQIQAVLEVELARPRSYEDPDLFRFYRSVISALGENLDRTGQKEV
jgi:NitT/TauT family transport system ATP-binding protein